MKKGALILMIVIGAFCLSGCKRIELDDTTEDAYVEYAVNAVINHDKNNMLKLERVEIATKEEQQWISDEEVATNATTDSEDSNDNADVEDNVTEDEGSYVAFENALGNASLTAKVKDIKECSSYPEGNELDFAMTATTGSRLVVIEMSLTNTSGESVTLDTTNGFSFKGIFNNVVRTNALLTVFDYSLNNNIHTIGANETKDVVLIYELNNERVSEVEKIVISVSRNDETYNVSVK